jgi:hypothetical protein
MLNSLPFLGAFLWYTAVGGSAPRPGDPMPFEVQQRVDWAADVLREAMARRDPPGVRAAADRLREALGDWAGVPDRRPDFRIAPDGKTRLGREDASLMWRNAWRDALRSNVIPGRDRPDARHNLLRQTAYVVMGGLAALRHHVGDRDEVRREVDRRLAYLLSVQRPHGLFPFPDLRGTDSKFAPILESHHRRWPEDFAAGWVIEDHGDGGLQFDNGVCAVTMITAYEQLGDERCLQSARRACEWVLKRPIVLNWNYNAFSIWAMARYTRATNDRRFLASAIERLQLGVLPGQLPSGRWMDRHNARTVYHAILLRAIADLYPVLSRDEPVRPVLADAIRRADRAIVDEIRLSGATDADHSLTALCAVERAIGPAPERTEAVRAILGAMRIQLLGRERIVLDDLTLFAVGQMLDYVGQ